MIDFHITDPSLESQWRAIILFGKNSATYKFAFAKSLFELANIERNSISLRELSEPFAMNIVNHIKDFDKQGNSASSKFLNTCRKYANGEIAKQELIDTTEKIGFVNVVDAFHIVNGESINNPFYQKDYQGSRKNIVITDELFKLKETFQYINLPNEVEARWKLVETAWNLKISPRLLEVNYDEERKLFFINRNLNDRINITSCRDSLNGYQRGKCFYCKKDITIVSGDVNLCEVDHFIPHTYASNLGNVNIDGVWNLVLACEKCNRKKLARIPELRFLFDLYYRNEHYIESKHPLAETIINQTGLTKTERQNYLKQKYQDGLNFAIHSWQPDLI